MSQLESMQFVLTTSTELEVALMEYVITLRQGGAAQSTVSNYEWHVKRLTLWLAERGMTRPRDVTRSHLREWGASLYDNWQPTTIRQAVSACKSFCRWCAEEGLIDDNPADVLKRPKEKKRIQRTITAEEVGKLLSICDIATVKGLRDRAIISLLYDSGLRAAEICRLRLLDVDLEQQRLKVIVKGGDERFGWFGETTAKRLRAWLRVRMVPPGVDSFFVAIGGIRPGSPLTISGLFRMLRNLGNKVRVPGVSPHSFRRGFAVHLTKSGVQNSVLQDLGRWGDEKMIKLYTLALEAEEIYRGRSPVDDVEENEIPTINLHG